MDYRRITVLHVIEGLGTGGSESQLAALLFRSDPARFRHEVCTLAQVGRFAGDLERVGVRVHHLGLRPEGDLVRAVAALWRVVRLVAPDIIHSSLYRPTIVARTVGRLTGTRVVTTLVNTTYEPEWALDNPRLNPRKVRLVQTIDRWTARWSGGRYVAITQSVKDSAVRRIGLPPDDITVIPRGLDVEGHGETGPADETATRAALGLSGAPIILNVARLVPQKGQRYAIRAMRHVVAALPSARLYIAGEGPLRPMLEELIVAEGLQAHVTLLGDRRDIGALLRAADLFVFPSLFEGLGNAVLEALAAGKPCVVSRIPALREITGDGAVALLADLQSPEDLAAHLVRLANDRALAERLGSAAQTWVRARYDIARSVAAHEAVYERITQRRPSWAASAFVTAVRRLERYRPGTLRVLVYHRVADRSAARGDPQVLSATPAAFAEQMGYLARHYAPISAHQAVAALRGEAVLPPRAVLVTFDDGYRDFRTHAWPVLKRHGIPALLFVATGFPGGPRAFWWDELSEMVTRTGASEVRAFGLALPLGTPLERWMAVRRLNWCLKPLTPADQLARMAALREALGAVESTGDSLLTWDDLRQLAVEGLAVGSHTRTHPALRALTEAQLRQELSGAYADLERELGRPVPLFSYPYGMADARAVPPLKALGYVAAFISLVGRNGVGHRDPFLLYRHSVDIEDSLTSFAMSLTSTYVGVRESGRAARALIQQSLSRWVPSR